MRLILPFAAVALILAGLTLPGQPPAHPLLVPRHPLYLLRPVSCQPPLTRAWCRS
jgi:hypothetical protein